MSAISSLMVALARRDSKNRKFVLPPNQPSRHFPKSPRTICRTYSARRASTGFTDAARCAEDNRAASVERLNTITTVIRVERSDARVPKGSPRNNLAVIHRECRWLENRLEVNAHNIAGNWLATIWNGLVSLNKTVVIPVSKLLS